MDLLTAARKRIQVDKLLPGRLAKKRIAKKKMSVEVPEAPGIDLSQDEPVPPPSEPGAVLPISSVGPPTPADVWPTPARSTFGVLTSDLREQAELAGRSTRSVASTAGAATRVVSTSGSSPSSLRRWATLASPLQLTAEAAALELEVLLERLFDSFQHLSAYLLGLCGRYEAAHSVETAQLVDAKRKASELQEKLSELWTELSEVKKFLNDANEERATTDHAARAVQQAAKVAEKYEAEALQKVEKLRVSLLKAEKATAEAEATKEAACKLAVDEYKASEELFAHVSNVYCGAFKNCQDRLTEFFPDLDLSVLNKADMPSDEVIPPEGPGDVAAPEVPSVTDVAEESHALVETGAGAIF